MASRFCLCGSVSNVKYSTIRDKPSISNIKRGKQEINQIMVIKNSELFRRYHKEVNSEKKSDMMK